MGHKRTCRPSLMMNEHPSAASLIVSSTLIPASFSGATFRGLSERTVKSASLPASIGPSKKLMQRGGAAARFQQRVSAPRPHLRQRMVQPSGRQRRSARPALVAGLGEELFQRQCIAYCDF